MTQIERTNYNQSYPESWLTFWLVAFRNSCATTTPLPFREMLNTCLPEAISWSCNSGGPVWEKAHLVGLLVGGGALERQGPV